ncbi:MAG: aspartate aminotransferase family protein [Chloroflexi bacterium]|nr:aspartate aminotransferase family protein [Chloroflexota bacterium]
MTSLLGNTANRAEKYLEGLKTRRVSPSDEAVNNLKKLDVELPKKGWEPDRVISLLDEVGSPATVASADSRYFGFVIGGSLPTALAANWLAGAWDQNGVLYLTSPVTAVLEEISEQWLVELLGLHPGTAVGFVTGATMANFSGLAAARNVLLERQGWDVEAKGLFSAPEIKVVVGEEYHASMRKALGLIGFGRDRVIKVPVDKQGRMIAAKLPTVDELTIVCLQAGNVNTGSFDPAEEIIQTAKNAGAWVHVDGAFGLWAKASPKYAGLAKGLEFADSIATDAHKWLNVPYDSGLVFVRDRNALARAMTTSAAYLIESGRREGYFYTPEMSRRGRGIEIWAALLSLGRDGLAELIDRCCQLASKFANRMEEEGFTVLNDVVLNQVLISFGDTERTNKVTKAIQSEGTMWAGGTEWQGTTAMRFSVSSWATTENDIEKSVQAIKQVVESLD